MGRRRPPAGETLKSFAIITTTANALLAPLHDRMPAVIPPDGWDDWLGENSMNGSVAKTLLWPYPDQPWRSGRRIAGWAMSETIVRICLHPGAQKSVLRAIRQIPPMRSASS